MEFASTHLLALYIFDSPMDIGIVVLIAVILFGGKKIPELMKGVGQGIREFKNGMRDDFQSPPTHATQAPPPAAPVSTPAVEEKK
jgi:sec-independent protein translocase protein TatA